MVCCVTHINDVGTVYHTALHGPTLWVCEDPHCLIITIKAQHCQGMGLHDVEIIKCSNLSNVKATPKCAGYIRPKHPGVGVGGNFSPFFFSFYLFFFHVHCLKEL